MNRRMVFYTIGQIIKLEAVLLVIPLIVALLYGESCALHLGIAAVVALVLGFATTLISRPATRVMYAKEGFVITTLSWLALSAIGALPFFLSGEIPSYIDAFFETVSGFTTTGASILTDVESMSRGLLFWRSFTHWMGGMGVLVLMMAILPTDSGRSMHMMRAEVPGPIVGKLVPRVRDTAKILYLIYLALTVVVTVLLLCGGMPLFDSVVHALGTAGTGGFGIYSDSAGSFSPYIQWVLTGGMLAFGVNFNLYYLLLLRRFRDVLGSRELWLYGSIVLIGAAIITGNIFPLYDNFGEAVRHAVFQVSSVVTTTGFSTADFNLWPDLSRGIIFLLLFVGGCAGSTAGGLKIARIQLLFKSVQRELRRLLHPRSVGVVKLEGRRVDDATVYGAGIYLSLYFFVLAGLFLALSYEPFGLESNLTAVITCFNNVGPGLGAVGPAGSFAEYSVLSKILLSFAMLLGRLEIYPLLLAFTPSIWMREKRA